MKWYPYFKKLTITAAVVVCLVAAVSVGAWLTTYFVGGFLLAGILHWWSRNLGSPSDRRAFLMLRTWFFLVTAQFPFLLVLNWLGIDKSELSFVSLILGALAIWGSFRVPGSRERAWFFGVRVFALGLLGAIITWILFWFWWANGHWTFCPEPGCNFGQWFWLSLALTLGLVVLGLTGGLAYEVTDPSIIWRAFWVRKRSKGQRGRRGKPIEMPTE